MYLIQFILLVWVLSMPSQAVWELLILLSWLHIALPCALVLSFKTRTLDTVA